MHDHLIALRKERPEIFGEIYDQLSFCKSVRQLFQNELLVDKTSLLLKCPRNSIYSTGINLRMDVPFDKRNTIDWHQDSAHNQNIDKKWRGIAVRIEDDILVTKAGLEVLTNGVPKQRDQIESLMA